MMFIELNCGGCESSIHFDGDDSSVEAFLPLVTRFAEAHALSCNYVLPLLTEEAALAKPGVKVVGKKSRATDTD